MNKKFTHRFVSPVEKCEKVTLSVEEMAAIQSEGCLEINRPIVKSHKKRLMRDIRTNRWVERSGNVIKFDIDGYVIDGRHRFLAHLEAKVPFTTYVIMGLDPKAILVTDVGKSRKAPDNTVLEKHIEDGTVPQSPEFQQARLIASVTKEMLRRMPNSPVSGYPTSQEIRDAEIRFAKEIAVAVSPVDNPDAVRPGYLAAVAVYASKDPKKAAEFREAVGSDGLDFPKNSPIRKLQRFLSESSDGGSQMLFDYRRTVYAIHAFHMKTPFSNLCEWKKRDWDF